MKIWGPSMKCGDLGAFAGLFCFLRNEKVVFQLANLDKVCWRLLV